MTDTAEIEREMREAARHSMRLGPETWVSLRSFHVIAILSALDEARERAEHAESFCYRAAKAAGQHEFVCAETVPLRAERDAAIRERDEARELLNANEDLQKADQEALFKAIAVIESAVNVLGDWMLVPPDGGDLTLAEGVDRLKAAYAEAARDRAALSDKLNGTPCAEIRWQQERDRLAAELAKYRCPIGAENGSPSCSAGTCPECNNMRARGAVDRLETLLREAGEVLQEMDELFEDTCSGNYTPDSFTAQPARALKAKIDAELNLTLGNEPIT